MSTYKFEWPSKRLRDQEMSVKPRIIVRPGGFFDVEYFGTIRGRECSITCLSWAQALEVAKSVSLSNKQAVEQINVRQAQARQIRRAARLGLPVAA